MSDILFKLLLAQLIWSLGFAIIWYANRLRSVKETKTMYQMLVVYFFAMPLISIFAFLNVSPAVETPLGMFTMPVLEINASTINPIPDVNSTLPSVGIAALAALFVMAQIVLFRRLIRQHTDAAATQQAQRLLEAFGKFVRVRVVRSPFTKNVFSFRFIRGYVVLPKELELSERNVQFVLAHELMHIVHHDFAFNLVQKLIRILAVINPLSHVLDRKIDHYRELCRDEEAIAALGCDAAVYSTFLIQLNQHLAQNSFEPIGATPLLKSSKLKERILWLNKTETNAISRLPMLLSIAALLIFAACTSVVDHDGAGSVSGDLSSADLSAITYYAVDKKPRVYKAVAPKYPKEAVDKKVEGMVIVNVVISKDGMPENVTVLKGHPLLNEAAITAIKKYEFTAGEHKGKKVKTKWQIPIRFKLNSDDDYSASYSDANGHVMSGSEIALARSSWEMKKKYNPNFPDSEPKPVILTKADPIYPEKAKELGIEGKVIVCFLVDYDGKAVSIFAEEGHKLLQKAAIEAIEKYTFKPAERNGEPVIAALQIPMKFKLGK